MKKNKGFTIIELLVVIVIIGVLTGMGIYSFPKLFKKTLLKKTMNNVRAFYERTNRYATSAGVPYKLEINQDYEFLRCMEDASITSTRDSLDLGSGLDLGYSGSGPMTFTITPDGLAEDDDNIRRFFIYDKETGDSVLLYISPLGVMEARIK